MRLVHIAAALLAVGLSFAVADPGGAAPTAPTALPAPAAQAAPDPIVFVHGWNVNGGVWNTMIDRFVAAGYPRNRLVAISYSSAQSNTAIANQVRAAAETLRAQSGAAKVDVVSHSMGGLSSRYYVKNLGGAAVVDDYVSLAGANHGTLAAWGCIWFSASCWDMLPGSAFLNALNAGDETPGAPRYGTWWSPNDGVISPASSTVLNGAENHQIGGVAHNDFLTRADIFQAVHAFVA